MATKLVIFDVDGVLVDSKYLHYKATELALKDFGWNYTYEQDQAFGTIPTVEKLKLLENSGDYNGLNAEQRAAIWKLKGVYTNLEFEKYIKKNPHVKTIFKKLKAKDIKIALASNARYNYVNLVTKALGIRQYVDYVLSAEDIKHKPFPTIYLSIMTFFDTSPFETIIVEDSETGKEAAWLSGATVYDVEDYTSLDNNLLWFVETHAPYRLPYIKRTLNVVIPMAGRGSRFPIETYKRPKPFIDVAGKPMIHRVVENLNMKANFIFIAQKEHIEKYGFTLPGITIEIDGVTEGAACTVLKAATYIDTNNPLLIVNSDNVIDWDSIKTMNEIMASQTSGSVFCFHEPTKNPKWSFAREENGKVVEVAEKNPISEWATTGHYFWKKGSDFCKYAQQMIDKNIRVNNEFYVAPVYNECIQDGNAVGLTKIKEMYCLGTPEDLEKSLVYYSPSRTVTRS